MEHTARILIIDDDRGLGEMLSEYLAGAGLCADIASDGHTGLEQALAGKHDAVVLDVMLPGKSGLDVLRELRMKSRVPVIMLTARGEDTDRIVGLELGADDYLPKPFNPRELVARLRAVLRRGQADTGEALEAGELRLDRHARRVSAGDRVVNTTAAEYAILERLMIDAGEVVSKDELANHALGRSLSPFDRSVDTHISRLRGKLGPTPDGEPRIQAVCGRGYLLVSH